MPHRETSKYADLITYANQKLNLFIQLIGSKHHSLAKPVAAHSSPEG
jgi:hypothetical protein